MTGYYKFCDFQAGDDRAYTEFKFEGGKFIMEVYTNKFNQVSPLQIHSRWKASLGDIDDELNVEPDHELFLLLTTESLFDGLRYNPENLEYISKYVYLPMGTKKHTFTHVHPGTYYLYSYNDVHGDKRHLAGDYMSSNINNTFTVEPEGEVTVSTVIDFVIP